MKKSILIIAATILATWSNPGICQESLTVAFTNWWNWGAPASFEEATLVVSPKGAYMNYDLYLTINSDGSGYNSASDQLEIVMDFTLPENSIIYDSWLWVGNDIMQAMIIDRDAATEIYEGIVDRQQDPSILYRNGNNSYQLRVFPLFGNEARKVKISYMVPTRWSNNAVATDLPLNIIKLSNSNVDLDLVINIDNTFKNAQFTGADNISILPTADSTIFLTTIPHTDVNIKEQISIQYDSPISSGLFAGNFTSVNGENFYQVLIRPIDIIGSGSTERVMVLLDHIFGNSTVSQSEIITRLKQYMKDTYDDNDYFGLVYGATVAHYLQSAWLPATDANIDFIFGSVPANYQNSGYLTKDMIIGGISLVNTQAEGGEILLVTNNDKYDLSSSVNNYINQVQAAQNPVVPVNIINYHDHDNFGYSQTLNGNGFFNESIASSSGGVHVKHDFTYSFNNWNNTFYIYSTNTSFGELMNQMFHELGGYTEMFNIHTEIGNGFTYAQQDLNQSGRLYYSQPFIQIGKYVGNGPSSINLSGLFDGVFIDTVIALNQVYGCDSLLRKSWAGNRVYDLEGELNTAANRELIKDISRNYRVLSEYTAFLALEPSDTIEACATCTDQTNTPPLVDIEEIEDALLFDFTASPSIFTSLVKFRITLPEDYDASDLQLLIYDVNGKIVRSFDISVQQNLDISIEWNGEVETGETLSSGSYLAVLITKTGTETIKLVKM